MALRHAQIEPYSCAPGSRKGEVHREERIGAAPLHRHDAHARSHHRLADRSFCIGRVVLAALEVGLDVARRHQPDLATERDQFAPQMVRSRARLDTDHSPSEPGQERPQIDRLRRKASVVSMATIPCHQLVLGPTFSDGTEVS